MSCERARGEKNSGSLTVLHAGRANFTCFLCRDAGFLTVVYAEFFRYG